jgi:hypothetical protein
MESDESVISALGGGIDDSKIDDTWLSLPKARHGADMCELRGSKFGKSKLEIQAAALDPTKEGGDCT